jgi:phage shock protein C
VLVRGMDPERSYLADSQRTGVKPRLWRSRNNKVVAGVVGGLAERLSVSATGLRWFVAVGTFFSGVFPGIVAYLILWAITEAHSSPSPKDRW